MRAHGGKGLTMTRKWVLDWCQIFWHPDGLSSSGTVRIPQYLVSNRRVFLLKQPKLPKAMAHGFVSHKIKGEPPECIYTSTQHDYCSHFSRDVEQNRAAKLT
jgi:hypothetical protein